jgi:hypothetical protein
MKFFLLKNIASSNFLYDFSDNKAKDFFLKIESKDLFSENLP